MVDILMSRSNGGLSPATSHDAELLAGVKSSGFMMVTVRKARSPNQLRLWWKLVELVAPSTDYETKDALAQALKIEVGAYDVVRELDGSLSKAPRSIALDAMMQDDFNAFFEASIDAICKHVLPGMSADVLRAEVFSALGQQNKEELCGT